MPDLLEIDEIQANAILDAAAPPGRLERQKIVEEHDRLQALIEEYTAILADLGAAAADRLRGASASWSTSTATTVGPRSSPSTATCRWRTSSSRRTWSSPITRGGYVKRTREDQYRAQKRGKGVRGASLREDDVVEHFFTTTTHRYAVLHQPGPGLPCQGLRVEPEAPRDAKAVANLGWLFQPDEHIASVLAIDSYEDAEYLVVSATESGLVKKTAMTAFDSNRTGGIIAINLRDVDGIDGTRPDRVIAARAVNGDDELPLVSATARKRACPPRTTCCVRRAAPPAASPA